MKHINISLDTVVSKITNVLDLRSNNNSTEEKDVVALEEYMSIDTIKLEKSILSLLENENLLSNYHNKSWINYKYNQKDIVKIQDEVRSNIFNKYNY